MGQRVTRPAPLDDLDAALADADALLGGGIDDLDAAIAEADALIAAPVPRPRSPQETPRRPPAAPAAPVVTARPDQPTAQPTARATPPPVPRSGRPALPTPGVMNDLDVIARSPATLSRTAPDPYKRPAPVAPPEPTVMQRLQGLLTTSPLEVVTEGAKGFAGGLLGTMTNAAGMLSAGAYAKTPEEAQRLMAPAADARARFAPSPEIAADILDKPGIMLDPTFWSYMTGQLAGSVASLVGAGEGGAMVGKAAASKLAQRAPAFAAKLAAAGGPAAATAGESLVEASDTYVSMIQSGKTPQEAADAAGKVFQANAVLLGLTNNPLFEAGGKGFRLVLKRALSEGGQEAGQTVVSNVAQGQEATEGLGTAALMGAVGGPVAGAMFDRLQAPPRPTNAAPAPAGAPGRPVPTTSAPVAAPPTPAQTVEQRIKAAIEASAAARRRSSFGATPAAAGAPGADLAAPSLIEQKLRAAVEASAAARRRSSFGATPAAAGAPNADLDVVDTGVRPPMADVKPAERPPQWKPRAVDFAPDPAQAEANVPEAGSGAVEAPGAGGGATWRRVPDRTTNRNASLEQQRAEAGAHDAELRAAVLDAARAVDAQADPAEVEAELDFRLELYREQQANTRDAGANPIDLLQAIAERGGLNERDDGKGQHGELDRLRDGNWKKAGAFGRFGGIPGVFRARTYGDTGAPATGLPLDVMLQSLQADPRFAHIEDIDQLVDILDDVNIHGADAFDVLPGTDTLRGALGIDPDTDWWRDSWRPPADPDAAFAADTIAPEGADDTSFDFGDLEAAVAEADTVLGETMPTSGETIAPADDTIPADLETAVAEADAVLGAQSPENAPIQVTPAAPEPFETAQTKADRARLETESLEHLHLTLGSAQVTAKRQRRQGRYQDAKETDHYVRLVQEIYDAKGGDLARIRELYPQSEPTAPPAPKVDTLDTGEQQTRLPGDVGQVRDEERAQPTEAVPEQSLILQAQEAERRQANMFGEPVPAARKTSRRDTSTGDMFAGNDLESAIAEADAVLEPPPAPAAAAPAAADPWTGVPDDVPAAPTVKERLEAKATPKDAAATAPGVSIDDIPYDLAVRAYSGTSHTPETRAREDRNQYVRLMNDVWNEATKRADGNAADLARAETAFRDYAAGYAERRRELLGKQSGIISSMVAGPANFPAARMNKRNAAHDARVQEFLEWERKARARVLAEARYSRPEVVSADRPDAPNLLQEKAREIQKFITQASRVNEVAKSGANNAQKLATLEREGIPEKLARQATVKNSLTGRFGVPYFEIQNARANLARVVERIDKLEAKAAAPDVAPREFDGGRIEVNRELNRVQVFLEGKPDEELRDRLKRNGFKWAPSKGAWQRQDTANARDAARRLFGVNLDSESAPKPDVLDSVRAQQSAEAEDETIDQAEARIASEARAYWRTPAGREHVRTWASNAFGSDEADRFYAWLVAQDDETIARVQADGYGVVRAAFIEERQQDDSGEPIQSMPSTIGERLQAVRTKQPPPRRAGRGNSLAETQQRQPGAVKLADTPQGARPADIVKRMAELLETPVGTGRLIRHDALGYFVPRQRAIRVRVANGLPVLMHEFGHAAERAIGLSLKDRKWVGELMQLGAATSRPSYTPKQIRMEGLAEYFRLWMMDPAGAQRRAPNFTAALEGRLDAMGELGKGLRDVQKQMQAFLNADPAARVALRIDFRGESNEALGDWATRARIRWTDDLHRLRQATEAMAGGLRLPATLNAYLMARIARGSTSRAADFTDNGVRDFEGQFIGPSLKAALAPVAKDLDRFSVYLVALRARELHQRRMETGLTDAEANGAIDDIERGPDRARFEQARDAIYAYQAAVLKYAELGGVLSPQSRAAIHKLNQWYVPFQRILEPDVAKPGTARRIADRLSPVKRIKGSGRDIINPLESIIKNTFSIVDAVEKNRAMLALTELVDKVSNDERRPGSGAGPWLRRIKDPQTVRHVSVGDVLTDAAKKYGKVFMTEDGPTYDPDLDAALQDAGIDPDDIVPVFETAFTSPKGERIVTVMRGGKRVFYQIEDPLLYDAIMQIAPAQHDDLKLAQFAAKLLRSGATLTLGFVTRNPARDTLTAFLQSRHGFIPIADTVRGAVKVVLHELGVRSDEEVAQFWASGVTQAALVGTDRKELRKKIRQLASPSTLRARTILHPVELMQAISAFSEVSTRVGEFSLALRQGGTQHSIWQRLIDQNRAPINADTLAAATLAARDVTTDFSRGGRVSKEWSQTRAFFNARVQGYVRIAETVKHQPGIAAMNVGALAMAAVALKALNDDDEDYQELAEWEKLAYWHWRPAAGDWKADFFIRIPKPFDWAFVPNLAEAAVDFARQQRPEAFDLVKAQVKESSRAVVLGGLPTWILPIVEVGANYSFFRQRPIVNPWDEDLPLEQQASDWTSQTARELTKLGFPMAPAKIDHLLYGHLAGLGRAGIGVVDMGLRGVGIAPPARTAPAPRWEDTPAIGAFMRSAAPKSDAESIIEFYEASREMTGTLRGYNRAKADPGQQGRILDAVKAQRWRGREAQMKAAKKQIDDLADRVDAVYDDQAMTPQQKTAALEGLRRAIVQQARAGLGYTQ